jgi:RHH-type proline utilization regulon transcriptional repressor/proline dehydrogenase/delta 1-pyrroline-5-carboxylate dehydrogenase
VVAVVSPWNFPLAIPCGGIAAALAAGNNVLLKPASDTVMIAYKLCECFWKAGVPRTALQFVPCSGATGGQHLVTHPEVDAVILTGGTETAQRMLDAKPTMRLFAETGGKNATIVTAMADRDMAIKNIVHSAFGHGGQKCSATSLLLLEDEVYRDAKFRETLIDAVDSLAVGSAWQLHTKMGPLINRPSGDLERGLKELEPGESWALMPRLGIDGNAALVSPGIKWNVAPDSYTHCTEFFGPVLAVMSFKNLAEAIDIVNATGFGLTSGIETLDDREIEQWRRGIRAGNLYINRGTTGAIVLRQPFGGMGKSNVGPGIKAGGPNYVAQFIDFEGVDEASVGGRASGPLALLATHSQLSGDGELAAALASYERHAHEEFLLEHDHFRLLGEDNHRRYLPLEHIQVRVDSRDSPFEIVARVAAARAVGCRVTVSIPPHLDRAAASVVELLDEVTEPWAGDIEFVEETDDELAALVRDGVVERVRYAATDRVPEAVRTAAAEALAYIADEPVSRHGRLELLWYVREQSISYQYHRYGNLGIRGNEPRDEPV